MRLKFGVRLEGLQPQTVVGMMVASVVCQRWGVECVITSCNDGKHSERSWHYKGFAFDLRTRFPELDGREAEFASDIRGALGPDFDVVLEAVGTPNEHLHIEYDPKPINSLEVV